MQEREVGMWKRLLSFVLAVMLSFTLSTPTLATNTSFSDVPVNFWAYDAIQAAVSKGITSGYADGTFKPGNTVTNAHFSAFLARAFYADECNDTGASPWYKPYTDTLENHGIYTKPSYMTGINTLGSNLDENINKAINRYDMAMMMYNVLKDKNAKMPTNAEMAAARNAIGDWDSIPAEYRGGVSLCYAMGILSGQSDGTFGGSNLMNRAQGCVVIYRLMQKIETGSTGIEPSVPEPPEEPSNPAFGPQTLANGKPMTEENVKEIMAEVKKEYPEGTPWSGVGTINNHYYVEGPGTILGEGYFAPGTSLVYACGGFAAMVSDRVFGRDKNPIRYQHDYTKVRVGDIVVYTSTSNGEVEHVAIVTDVSEYDATVYTSSDAERYPTVRFRTADGNTNPTGDKRNPIGGYITWPKGNSTWQNKALWENSMGMYVNIWTRYPESYDDIPSRLAGENAYREALKTQKDKTMRCANCGFVIKEPGGKINANGDCYGSCSICHNWYLCGQCFSATAMQQHMNHCAG